jgi:hypothetical protein
MPNMNTYEKWMASMLKAEVVCAELLENNNLSFDQIKYIANSSFRKSFRTDVDTITDNAQGIEIAVNRDGLYDRLPEGLFHQTRGNSGSKVSEMVAEHKRYKAEEKSARRFFSPFEQEFFRYSQMTEQEERKLTGSMYDERMQQLFRNLWELDNQLPDEAVGKLLRIIPWASHIKCDLQLTTKTLEMVLGKPVSFEESITESQQTAENSFLLGDCGLGMDTLAGSGVYLPMAIWKFTIGDISGSEIGSYINGNSYDLFLRKFEDIFIPLDIDAVFEFETVAKEEEMTEAVLGFSLTI